MPSWQIAGDYFETCSCDYLSVCADESGRDTDKGLVRFRDGLQH